MNDHKRPAESELNWSERASWLAHATTSHVSPFITKAQTQTLELQDLGNVEKDQAGKKIDGIAQAIWKEECEKLKCDPSGADGTEVNASEQTSNIYFSALFATMRRILLPNIIIGIITAASWVSTQIGTPMVIRQFLLLLERWEVQRNETLFTDPQSHDPPAGTQHCDSVN